MQINPGMQVTAVLCALAGQAGTGVEVVQTKILKGGCAGDHRRNHERKEFLMKQF